MTNKETYRNLYTTGWHMPVFAQPWWLDAVCAEWDVAIATKGDQTTGAWPYPIEKKMGVTMMRTPMLTPYLGPITAYPADLKASRRDSYEHETITELIKQLPDAQVWNLTMPPGLKQAGIFRHHKLELSVQQTFLLQLQQDEKTLLENMKEAARRNIRAAEKEMTIGNEPEQLKELFEFQKNTLTQKGKSFKYSLPQLQVVMNAALANHASALWVARTADNTIQAIVWQVWDATTSYYLMGGQNPEGSSFKAMTLLLWHSMKQAKTMGHNTFDLEGSMDEGVERFFRNFGGERELYLLLSKNESALWKAKQAVFK